MWFIAVRLAFFIVLLQCLHTSLLICFQIRSSTFVIWNYVHKKMCVCIGNPKTTLVCNREVWDLLLLLKNFKLSRSSFHPAQTALWLITFCPVASLQSLEKIFLFLWTWILFIPLPLCAVRYLFSEKTHWSTTCNGEFTGDCEGITRFVFTPLTHYAAVC